MRNDYLKQLAELGYARIPSVFNHMETDLIRRQAYAVLPQAKQRQMVQASPYDPDRPALMFWPQDLAFDLWYVARHPWLLAVVQEVLGPEVLQLNNQIYFRQSGDRDQFGWHQDLCFRTPAEDFDGIENRYLQTLVVVDAMTADSGAIEFLPGSHLQGWREDLVPRDDSQRGLREFDRRGMTGVKLEAEPGDLLLWSVLAVHGSEPNVSTANRMAYMNGFAAADAVRGAAAKEFPTYLPVGRSKWGSGNG